MKTTLLITTMAFGAGLSHLNAADTNASFKTDHYFVHPRATLTIETTQGGRGTAELSRNFAHPTPDHPELHFRTGLGYPNGAFVGCDFVGKTKHGDVYVFEITRPGGSKSVMPVLFTGTNQTVVATKDLTVRILSEPPKKE